MHESYKSPNVNSNDIALLKLAEKVDLNIHTPACLPALNNDYTGKTGSVYGESRIRHVRGFKIFLSQDGAPLDPVLAAALYPN